MIGVLFTASTVSSCNVSQTASPKESLGLVLGEFTGLMPKIMSEPYILKKGKFKVRFLGFLS